MAAVYVVDDDPDMRQTVVDILAIAGISAEGFGSGAAALAPHGPDRPDLAVVDQRLPDTTGIDLATSLKAADPDLAVILLTGYVSADNAIAAVGVVDDYPDQAGPARGPGPERPGRHRPHPPPPGEPPSRRPACRS